MKQLTLNVKEGKYNFFIELIKNLDFVQVEEDRGDSIEEITANLEQAFIDLNNYKQGKLKTSSAKDFVNEL